MEKKDKGSRKQSHTQLEAVADWALDIAAKLVNEDDDDLDAIDSVRVFVHELFAGRRAEIPLSDLLRTIGILVSSIEVESDNELSLAAPLLTMLETPSRLPALLRCPGAPAAVQRRCPARNEHESTTQLAA